MDEFNKSINTSKVISNQNNKNKNPNQHSTSNVEINYSNSANNTIKSTDSLIKNDMT